MGSSLSAVASSYAVIDEKPALIPSGEYELKFDYSETKVLFGRAPKLVLWFTVVSFGEYFNRVQLPRYYNVSKLLEKPKKFGRFKVGSKSDFLREYATLFTTPLRLDRVPLSAFENVALIGTVRTVTHGANQQPIPPPLQYSVIERLVGLKQ